MTGPTIETVVRVTGADGTQTTFSASSAPDGGTDDGLVLTYDAAATLTAQIGRSLDHCENLIARAFVGRAWQALGFRSWDAWIDAHFGDRPLMVVARSDRATVVHALSSDGMSSRAIGRVLGIDARTARRDLAGAADAPADDSMVIGRDGKAYRRTIPADRDGAGPTACALCGEQHPEPVDECPSLKADLAHLFGPIVLSADDDPEPVIPPPAPEAQNSTPRPRPKPAPPSDRSNSTRPARTLVAKFQVALEQVVRLIDLTSVLGAVAAHPESASDQGWTAGLTDELAGALTGLRGQLDQMDAVLGDAEESLDRLRRAVGS